MEILCFFVRIFVCGSIVEKTRDLSWHTWNVSLCQSKVWSVLRQNWTFYRSAFCWKIMENRHYQRHLWFQQDGVIATRQTTSWTGSMTNSVTVSSAKGQTFPGPHKAQTLTPLDLWFWGSAGSEVLRMKSEPWEDLIVCVKTITSILTRRKYSLLPKIVGQEYKNDRSVFGGHFQHLVWQF